MGFSSFVGKCLLVFGFWVDIGVFCGLIWVSVSWVFLFVGFFFTLQKQRGREMRERVRVRVDENLRLFWILEFQWFWLVGFSWVRNRGRGKVCEGGFTRNWKRDEERKCEAEGGEPAFQPLKKPKRRREKLNDLHFTLMHISVRGLVVVSDAIFVIVTILYGHVLCFCSL